MDVFNFIDPARYEDKYPVNNPIEKWKQDLRLKVSFDRNQDAEVCILFIEKLLAYTRQETVEAAIEVATKAKKHTPNLKKGRKEDDIFLGYNRASADIEAGIRKLNQ